MSAARKRLAVVLTFVLGCLAFVGYLWNNAGGHVPLTPREEGYQVAVDVADVDNMVPYADVAIAGVKVGTVKSMERREDAIRLTLRLTEVAGLHQGATVQVSEKSLFGQPFVKVVDGTGAAIPDGALLPASAVEPSVQLHDVLAGLDAPTRAALRSTLRSAGIATGGRSASLSRALAGLGKIGDGGHTVLDALEAQSEDLADLTRQLPVVLSALDSGQRDLASLVESGNRLLSATASQSEALQETVRALPGTLTEVREASDSLSALAPVLAPVAADLAEAAPDLNAALLDLAPTTRDLNALLPSLDGTLDALPATLTRVPALADDLRPLLPNLGERLRDVNPMARYLSPYGLDIGSFIANFSASYAKKTTDGRNVLALIAGANEMSVRGNPVNLGQGLLTRTNPYPAAGSLLDMRPFSGKFPRLYRDPE